MRGNEATNWIAGLNMLLLMIPRSASPAHWRWTLSCIKATSTRGATGFLPRSNLRALLRVAN
eukprot:2598681-Prymnesium_polylepis.1